MPFVWAYSAEHHTGKTTALNLVKALTGQFSWGEQTRREKEEWEEKVEEVR